MHRATWTNGKRSITGWWIYQWAAQRFYIELDSRDRITGQPRSFVTDNDTPEWGRWKLVRPAATISLGPDQKN